MFKDSAIRSLALAAIAAVLAANAVASEAVAPLAGSVERTRCNDFNDAQVAWQMVASGSDRPLPLGPVQPPVLLPDGSFFKTWEQPAEHRRTFFVAQGHAQASDENPGTEDRPWKTIGRAAAVLEPGDRVVVKEGLYREWVRPARGGTGPSRMITYQAAKGERAILTGSERLVGDWVPSLLAGHTPLAEAWMIDLSAAMFQDYNPFAETNISPTMSKNPYNRGRWNAPPYTLPRGLVFQDGQRLTQVAQYEELAGADGAYWVEPGGRRIHVRPLRDRRPGSVSFEVTTRPFALAPEKAGLGFIRVDGFVVEHVSNCVPVPQLGAISTAQGHHWIIENNVVRQVNGVGLDYGRRQTFIPYEVPADTPKLAGVATIVRRNVFEQCGASSLSGLGLIGGLVEDNYSTGCGWRRVGGLAESAGIKLHYLKHSLVRRGIKLHYLKHSLVRRNAVRGTFAATGLWVDHSNHNSRVTGNIIVGAEGNAFFLEATYGPMLIDHNIFWDCKGPGFLLAESSNATIANNLVGNCTKQPLLARASRRVLDIETARMASAEHNRIVANVFFGFGHRGVEVPDGSANMSDYNMFVNPPDAAKPFDLAAWRKRTGREMHSVTFASRMEFVPQTWTLRQTPLPPVVQGPRILESMSDYFGTPRPVGHTTEAGPFLPSNLRPEMVLFKLLASAPVDGAPR
jgi:hypothetical protein